MTTSEQSILLDHAVKSASHWRDECMQLRAALEALLADKSDDPVTRRLAAGLADKWRDGVMAALPVVREYARQNPHHYMGDALQDPHGAHAWLDKYDPSRRKQCGECHLQPGERCDICGALQGT